MVKNHKSNQGASCTSATYGARPRQRGYALLMLMFFVALLLIATTVATPRILIEGKRDKEQEMVWRGKQYVRGVKMYYRKTGRFPQSIDDLTKPKLGSLRFMRQAYKDPMNGEDGSWRLIYVGPAGQLIGSLKPPQTLQLGGSTGTGLGAPASAVATQSTGQNNGQSSSGFGSSSFGSSSFGNANNGNGTGNSSFGNSSSGFGGNSSNGSGFGSSAVNNNTSNLQNPAQQQNGGQPPAGSEGGTQGGPGGTQNGGQPGMSFNADGSPATPAPDANGNGASSTDSTNPQGIAPSETTIIGGNIIGVGSKKIAPSLMVYDKAKNYHLFEFIWDPSKDTTVAGAPLQTGPGLGQGIGGNGSSFGLGGSNSNNPSSFAGSSNSGFGNGSNNNNGNNNGNGNASPGAGAPPSGTPPPNPPLDQQ